MKPKTLCSNCGKPIGKIGVMSPTIDEMRRQQCVGCADKWLKPKTPAWEKDFDKYVNELRIDLGTEKIYYFGYKHKKDNEFHVVVDWGNIKSFIRQAIQTEVTRERERIRDEFIRGISPRFPNKNGTTVLVEVTKDFIKTLKG